MVGCAAVQDVFMLFGDSITQGAWDIGLNGIGQRLNRESFLSFFSEEVYTFVCRCIRTKARCPESRAIGLQHEMEYSSVKTSAF